MDSDSLADDAARITIPDHTLLRCIGRGAFGEVWLARNIMGVYRAAKIVFRKSEDDQRALDRELAGIRRYEPISRSYEGFVDILHIGINEPEGYFYYLMELGDDQVSGQEINPETYAPKTLANEIARRGNLGPQDCLKLGLDLSKSMAELHKNGLVHRDVKPSNIIFVNGVAKLADIGLVTGANEARSFVGTEGYIPQEGPGSPQADVYGLGKVLYEACTGKDRLQFPDLPTRVDEFADDARFLELNEICLQACATELARRYQSAWDMHASLVVVANGKSVKRLRLLERRLGRAKRWAATSLLVAIFVSPFAYQFYRERKSARTMQAREAIRFLDTGISTMNSGDFTGALPYLAAGLRTDMGKLNDEFPQLVRIEADLAQSAKITKAMFLGGQINDVALSPDGNHLLVAQARSPAWLYDSESESSRTKALGPNGFQISVDFSLDGKFAVTAMEQGVAYVWNVATQELVCKLPHDTNIFSARFSHDGKQVVTACADGSVRIWDSQTAATISRWQPFSKKVRFATFSPNDQQVVAGDNGGTALMLDARTGTPIGKPLLHHNWVWYAAFSPDGKRLLTACADRKARLWDLSGENQVVVTLEHNGPVTSAEFSPDGRLFVTSCFDGTVQLWSSDSLQPLKENSLLRVGGRVVRAHFAADGHRILVAASDGSVRVWDLAAGVVLPTHVSGTFSEDGRRFLLCTNNSVEIKDSISHASLTPVLNFGTSIGKSTLCRNGLTALVSLSTNVNSSNGDSLVQAWNVADRTALGPPVPCSESLSNIATSGDGTQLVVFNEAEARIWNLRSKNAQPVRKSFEDRVNAAAWSPDGHFLAICAGRKVHIFDPSNSQAGYMLIHSNKATHAEFSPNGKLLATSCADAQTTKLYAQVWNAASGSPVGKQLKHQDGVLSISFSPDSSRVVTASQDSTAIVWDALTGRQLRRPLPHAGRVKSAVFSSNGKWIATISLDTTAQVWDAETGDPVTPVFRHPSKIAKLSFIGDGPLLALMDEDGKTWVWSLTVEKRPVEDLVDLSLLLAGGKIDLSTEVKQTDSGVLESLWQKLSKNYPELFKVLPEQETAWYERQARECELDQLSQAATFHLERLRALRPADQTVSERLARAKARLSASAK